MAVTISNAMTAKIGVNNRELRSGMREADRIVNRVGNRMRRNFRRAALAVGAVGAAATGLGIAFGRSVVKAASTAEDLRLRLDALLGSTEEGARAFQLMTEFAAGVPFEFEQIMSSATQLAGILEGGADEIAQTMPLIADLAAVSGLSIEKTTEQIIRAFSAGIGSADLFRERGITAMLGFEAGATVSAEDTRRQIVAAWEDTESQFRGASERMASTWTGITSMLSDRWFQFRNLVADAGIFDAVKRAADSLVSRLDELSKSGRLKQAAERISDLLIGAIDVAIRGIGLIGQKLVETINFFVDHPSVGSAGLIGLVFGGPAIGATAGILTFLIEKLKGQLTDGVDDLKSDMLGRLREAQAELTQLFARESALTQAGLPITEELKQQVDDLRERIRGMQKVMGVLTGPEQQDAFEKMIEFFQRMQDFSFKEFAEEAGNLATNTQKAGDAAERALPHYRAQEEAVVATNEEIQELIRRAEQDLVESLNKGVPPLERYITLSDEIAFRLSRIGDSITNTIVGGAIELVTNFNRLNRTVLDVARSIARQIVGAITRAVIQAKVLDKVIKAISGGGGGGSLFGSLLGGVAGALIPGVGPLLGAGVGGLLGGIFGSGGGSKPFLGKEVFQRGGIIPGSGARAIIGHGGEVVLNRRAVAALGGAGVANQLNRAGTRPQPAASSGVTIENLSLAFPGITTARQLKRELPEIIRDLKRKGRIE